MSKPTVKESRFIDFYVITGNATESARRAGYSPRSAKQVGSKLLSKFSDLIAERMASFDSARIATQYEILCFLSSVMRGEYKDKQISRLKAAELLGKRYGLFKACDKGTLPVPVVITGGNLLED